MNLYTELYSWIWITFGKDKFSIDEFRSVFPTSQAPKVVHDMAKKGYLIRFSRGFYKALEPNAFVRRIVQEETALDILQKAIKPFAFCDSTAVTIWTDGYYWSGFTKGFKPVHIAIDKKDLSYWKEFLKNNGARFAIEGESRTLFGQVYILHPRKGVKPVSKEGSYVIPLQGVIKYCLDLEMVYEPALEYLDKKYSIGYKKREHLRS